jgi:hypothetical protein
VAGLTSQLGCGNVLFRGVVLLAGIAVALLAAAEVLLRAFDSTDKDLGPGSTYQWEAELGWSPVPNAGGTMTSTNRSVPVKNNSIGLRERELSEIAPDRILFLGDSFTYGFDAELEERFSNLLQAKLPQLGTVNAGVSGYGTDQQLLMMRRLWEQVRPRLVVVTFCVDNDRDDNTSSFRYRRYYKPYFVLTPEGEWQVRGYPLPTRSRSYGWWAEHVALVRFAVDATWALQNREVIVPDRTEGLIGLMRRTVEERGARLVLGLQRHEPRLEAYLRAQNIPYTTFDEAPRYPTAGGHWTPEGNAIVASKYLELFARVGIATTSAQQSSESIPSARVDPGGSGVAVAHQSVLSPAVWREAARSLPEELGGLVRFVSNWFVSVMDSNGLPRLASACAVLVVLALGLTAFWVRWRHRIVTATGAFDRLGRALPSFGVFLGVAVAWPLVTITLLEATEVRMLEVSSAVMAAVVVAAFGHGVALGLFAPDAPQRRLIRFDDATARLLAGTLAWAMWAVGLLILLRAVHNALTPPAALVVVTNGVFVLGVGVLLVRALWSCHRAVAAAPPLARWLVRCGWVMVAAIVIALIAGDAARAAAVVAGVMSVVAVSGTLYLLLALGGELFAERLADHSLRGKAIAAGFGVSPQSVGVAVVLACGGLALALGLAALVLSIGIR